MGNTTPSWGMGLRSMRETVEVTVSLGGDPSIGRPLLHHVVTARHTALHGELVL